MSDRFLRHLNSLQIDLELSERRIQKQCLRLDSIATELRENSDAAPKLQISIEQLISNAEHAFKNQTDSLSLTERNVLVHHWQQVDPALMNWICKNERLRLRLGRSLINGWETSKLPILKGYFDELQSSQLLNILPSYAQNIRVTGAEFPKQLAMTFSDVPSIGLCQRLRSKLQPLTLRRTLAASVLANIAIDRSTRASQYDELIGHIAHEEPRMLTFSDKDPAKVAPLQIQILMVVSLLNRIHGSQEYQHPTYRKILDGLRFTPFGDPRRRILSESWNEVKKRTPKAFTTYLSLLNEQDIRFFFNSEEVDMNVRRRDFWQKYIGSMEQTIVILDRDVYKTMESRYKHGESDARRAFEMARVFRQSSEFHALIMIFENVVAVEFHDTGAACVVVPRHVFDDVLIPLLVNPDGTDNQKCAIQDNKHIREAVLKHQSIVRKPLKQHSWPHTHSGWEHKFLKKLGDEYNVRY